MSVTSSEDDEISLPHIQQGRTYAVCVRCVCTSVTKPPLTGLTPRQDRDRYLQNDGEMQNATRPIEGKQVDSGSDQRCTRTLLHTHIVQCVVSRSNVCVCKYVCVHVLVSFSKVTNEKSTNHWKVRECGTVRAAVLTGDKCWLDSIAAQRD